MIVHVFAAVLVSGVHRSDPEGPDAYCGSGGFSNR
jgi:hypothetical protein